MSGSALLLSDGRRPSHRPEVLSCCRLLRAAVVVVVVVVVVWEPVVFPASGLWPRFQCSD